MDGERAYRGVDRFRLERTLARLDLALAQSQTAADAGDVHEAERLVRFVNELANDPELPRDVVRAMAQRAMRNHLDAARKATELALERAAGLAGQGRSADCARELGRARAHLGVAFQLGAGGVFTQAAEARIGTISMSAALSGKVERL